MATTSIWRVKGWLGKVVVYVENPDKTTNPKFYTDEDMTEQDGQELSDVIRYAVNSRKTQKADNEDCAVVHRFVSGINCSPSTARDEMLAVKKRFGKENGTVAYHGYQSFAPGEATPEMAHEIGMKLAARLWGDRYQVIVATHLDKENHLHNHFVLNTVSFVDGIKYHRTKKDYHDMQTVSDELCREYRLSVIENPQYGKAKQYGEWRAEQEQRPTWRGLIRADIDEAIRQSMTERQFFDNLRKKGYEVKIGKDISVRPPGKERFVRLIRNFGEDYSIEQIRRRILSQTRAEKKPSEPTRQVIRIRLFGSLKKTRKITGFRALYVHYCYLLGMNRDSYRLNHVSVIYQNFNLFQHLTVLENAAYPLYVRKMPKKKADELAAEKLLQVGLKEDQFKRFPNMLSGGEQQRVAIARALTSGSELILADEPTGNLDSENSRNIVGILQGLAHEGNRCVIIVTHDPAVAEVADVLLKMKDGKLIH